MEGRRGALRWMIRGFLSLWGLGAAGVGISFLRAPETERRPGGGLIKCGPLTTLPVGDARLVRHGAEPVLVVRVSETEVLGLSAVCTHMKCVLTWDQPTGTILCPCHAGAFDRTGNVLSGPPPRPLPELPVEIRADEIVVRAS